MSKIAPSAAYKIHDGDSFLNNIFVTGFFYDKLAGKVYSTLTKLNCDDKEIHYHIGLEQVYSSKYEVGALLTRFRVSSSSNTDYLFMCHE